MITTGYSGKLSWLKRWRLYVIGTGLILGMMIWKLSVTPNSVEMPNPANSNKCFEIVAPVELYMNDLSLSEPNADCSFFEKSCTFLQANQTANSRSTIVLPEGSVYKVSKMITQVKKSKAPGVYYLMLPTKDFSLSTFYYFDSNGCADKVENNFTCLQNDQRFQARDCETP